MSRYRVVAPLLDEIKEDSTFARPFFTDNSRKVFIHTKKLLNTVTNIVFIEDREKRINLIATLENGKIKLAKQVHAGELEDALDGKKGAFYTVLEAEILLGERPENTTREDVKRAVEKRDHFADQAVSDFSRAASSFGVEIDVEKDVKEFF